jgi:fibronectin-binding autotransporter adhesin
MRKWIKLLVFLWAAWATGGAATAQDTGANSSGTWETPSIWTGGTVPNSSNNVFIGSTYPSGAAATATVTLIANESAANVYLGYGSGTSGTLNLGGNTLSITGSLFVGDGGTGVLNEGGGSFTATNAYVQSGNSLTFGAGDAVSYLQLNGSSSATTAATGNVTGNIDVYSGSTLTLGANLSLTGNLALQDGSTFNAAGNTITASEVLFGWNGSSAVTLQNLSNITATDLLIGNGLNFTVGSSDTITNFYLNSHAVGTLDNNVAYLQLNSGASASTTGTGTVTGNIDVYSGSTLTLGANLSLAGYLNVQDGSTFNAAGNTITANEVLFGWNGSSAVTLQNLSNITATSLLIGNGLNFTVGSSDTITNLYLNTNAVGTLDNNVSYLQLNNGSSASTTALGTVTGSIDVYSGSTLTLGANLSLSGNLNVQDGSTFNAAGNTITAGAVLFGWNGSSAVTLQNLSNITATSLYIGNGLNFTVGSIDTITNFYLNTNAVGTLDNNVSYLQLNNGSSASTTALGTVTGSIDVYSGSTLTLGANLSLTGNLNVQDGSTFNAAGNTITANAVLFGWNGSSGVTLQNLSNITATSLYIGNGLNFTVGSNDTITNFYLDTHAVGTLNNNVSYLQLNNGSSASTTALGTVTGNIDAYSGSTLTLGANLSLTGYLNVQDGSTVNAQGHAVTADSLLVGYNGSSAVTLINLGPVALTNLYVGNTTAGSNLTLHGGDVVNSLIELRGGSVLTVQQTGGIGLTLNGTSASSLTIDPSSMDLIFNLNSTPNWDFRWKDPATGGNWISTIDGMIAAGEIVVSSPDGYSVVDQGGYTYIMGAVSSIPEPSSLVLACLASVGVAVGAQWRRRRGR